MQLITTTNSLAEVCGRLQRHPFVTVDTEFLRESTYYPKLCVAQLASTDEAVVVDALAHGIDLKPLFHLMADESVIKVFHAARQDIEICWHAAGLIPAPLVDTQVAAMVLGYGDSIAYVKLEADLKKRGRTEWMREEMRVLTSPDTYRMEPEHAWQRLQTRVRKPKELAVLIEVAAWREREAQTRDVPRGRVLKDDVVGDLAVQAPTTIERLGNLRSLPKGFERSKWGEAIIEAVRRGLARDVKTLPKIERPKGAPNGQATVELLKVLLRMTAERHGVAAKVIATMDDLDRIAADDDADVPALSGWRRELFGEKALALKHGQLALAVEHNRVVAVERKT